MACSTNTLAKVGQTYLLPLSPLRLHQRLHLCQAFWGRVLSFSVIRQQKSDRMASWVSSQRGSTRRHNLRPVRKIDARGHAVSTSVRFCHGAGEGIRTLDVQLGKLTLYH